MPEILDSTDDGAFYARFGEKGPSFTQACPMVRYDEWRKVERDARCCARSAIFCSAENLGVIIIDEET